jgi:hypothetical protein
MLFSYENMFKGQPKEYVTPLEKGDHPELDNSEFCDAQGIRFYQTMIGQFQWLIALGRFDTFTATMSMSRWRVAPRVGHLERLKRMYGYIKKFPDGFIRYRTDEPDHSGIQEPAYDWSSSIYGKVQEMIGEDIPEPKGKPVILTTYKDANLYHDLITGRSVTAVLHLINQTPFDWYTKRQSTVETSTFGSEFVAARIAVDQIIENRTALRYLGVPIKGKTILLGDNESVVKNATVPHSQLKKRHVALSFHRVREAIVAGIILFGHISGKKNVADVLSKHWGFTEVWPLLKALLFWRGDTSIIGDEVAKKGEMASQLDEKTDPTRDDGELHGSHQTRGPGKEEGSKGSNTSHASPQDTSMIQVESMEDSVSLGRSKPQPRATMTEVMDRG